MSSLFDATLFVVLIVALGLIHSAIGERRRRKRSGKEISTLRVKRERILLGKIERRDLTIQKLRFEIKTLKEKE